MKRLISIKSKLFNLGALGKHIFWAILGSGLSRLFLVIGTILVANILGKEDYGKFGILRNFINLLIGIIGFTFANTCTKFISEFRNKQNERLEKIVSLSIWISLLIGGLVVFIVLLIPENFINNFFDEEISSTLKITLIFLPIILLGVILEGVFRGFEWFKSLSYIQIVSSLFFLLILYLLSTYLGLIGALIALVSYYLMSTIIGGGTIIKKTKKLNLNVLTKKYSFQEIETIKRFTIPVILGGLIEAPVFLLSQILIVKDSGFGEMGAITAITQIRNLIILLPGYVIGALLPRMSFLASENNFSGYKKVLNRTLISNLIFSIICVIPFYFFSEALMSLFGKEFIYDQESLHVSLLFLPLFILSNVLAQDLLAKGYSRENLIISIIWNTVFIIMLVFFLKILDKASVAFFLSQGCGIVIMFGLRYFYSNKFKNLRKDL